MRASRKVKREQKHFNNLNLECKDENSLVISVKHKINGFWDEMVLTT